MKSYHERVCCEAPCVGSTSDDPARGVAFISWRRSIKGMRELETKVSELLGHPLDRARRCQMYDVV